MGVLVLPEGLWEESSGVAGASVVFDSLLGPMPPPVPDWSLRWAATTPGEDEAALSLFVLLGGLPVSLAVRLGSASPGLVLVEVGVGGVFTMVGPEEPVPGGVCGRREVSSLGCGGRAAREGDFAVLGSRGGPGGSILGDDSARSVTASSWVRSGLEVFFLDRKMPLKRPAGEVDRRETLLGDRSDGD